MDIAHVRRNAEEYVAESLRIMEKSGIVTVSDQQRREMIEATMRVAGFDVTGVDGNGLNDQS